MKAHHSPRGGIAIGSSANLAPVTSSTRSDFSAGINSVDAAVASTGSPLSDTRFPDLGVLPA